MKTQNKSSVKCGEKKFLGEISFHLNHYEELSKSIYMPILKQLRKEGWKLDRKRCRKEKMGIYTFNHRWVKRKFYM